MQIDSIHFSSIPSTNDWVKEHYRELHPKRLSCITAGEQTAGRGRAGKTWISPKDLNLYMTLYFTLPSPCHCLSNLAQLLSISCCKTLEQLKFHPKIKWPNDLLLDNKKVAGILCELVTLEQSVGVILGIGLNVNMGDTVLQQVNQPATSLQEISGHTFSLPSIQERLTTLFLEDLSLLQQRGFSSFYSYYNERLSYKNSLCLWKEGGKEQQIHCLGVSQEGALLASLPSGELLHIMSGEIRPVFLQKA